MNKSVIIILFIASTILLTSCDPGKVLIIKTNNIHDSVTVYTHSNISGKYNDTDLIITVPFNDTLIKRFTYGMGNWPDVSVRELADEIDSIVFKKNTNKISLTTRSEIESYLLKHRSGYAGSVLMIEAK